MKKREVWMPIAVAIALIGMWEFCVDVFHIPLYLLPSPSRILISLYENRSVLFSHAMVTLVEALLGLGIALVLAMSTAILLDISKTFRNSVYPH